METDENTLYKPEIITLKLDEKTSEKDFLEKLTTTLKHYDKKPEKLLLRVYNPPAWLDLITKMGDEELEEWLKYKVNEYYSFIEREHKHNKNKRVMGRDKRC